MQTPNQKLKTTGWVLLLVLLLSLGAKAQESPRQIVISIPDRKLALIENGEVVRVYPIAVGKTSTPSPTGSFKIVTRLDKPTYYHKGKIVTPGPQNPIGSRWMGLNTKGYGIHGTNEPKSIGKASSHGCFRLGKRDVEDLFARVQVGDSVEVMGERDDTTARLFGEPAFVLASASAPATSAANPAPVTAPASTTGQ